MGDLCGAVLRSCLRDTQRQGIGALVTILYPENHKHFIIDTSEHPGATVSKRAVTVDGGAGRRSVRVVSLGELGTPCPPPLLQPGALPPFRPPTAVSVTNTPPPDGS